MDRSSEHSAGTLASKAKAAIACGCSNAGGPIQPGVGARFRLRHAGDRSRHSCLSRGGCLQQRKSFLRRRHGCSAPSRDVAAGRCDRTLGKTGSDSLRERPGMTCWHFLSWCEERKIELSPHSTRTTQRAIAERVLKRKLVSQCAHGPRSASGEMMQWRTAHSSLSYRRPNEFVEILQSPICNLASLDGTNRGTARKPSSHPQTRFKWENPD